MSNLSTTEYEHVQLQYLSSRTWTVDPVRIDSPVEGAYLRYTNNVFAWDLSGPNILGFDSTFGQINQTINNKRIRNNYVILEVDESIYPGERVGLVIQPRVDGEFNTFISTQIPDGTTKGGNVRGNYAIDMQLYRSHQDHVASGNNSTISGGSLNKADGKWSTIGGGMANKSIGESSIISGGIFNESRGEDSTISGGNANIANGASSTISGGNNNKSNGPHSTISGGSFNEASGESSFIGGGNSNKCIGDSCIISGGIANNASGKKSTISGGHKNSANRELSTISGGSYNQANADYSTISGGSYNIAEGKYSTISGQGNRTKVNHAFVIGKYNKDISDRVFMLGWGDINTPKTVFSVDKIGNVYAKDYLGNGADIAEYYETTGEHLPIGTTVVYTNKNHYIRASNDLDDRYNIIGVVSDTAGVTMNAGHSEWHAKYVNGEINPLYDDKLLYIPRMQRDEWHPIGLLGKCKVLKNQPIGDRWIYISADDNDDKYDWYLIR